MKVFRIVIADDDEDDFSLLKEAFAQTGAKHMLIHLKDGEELISYLYDQIKLSKEFPDLVILDINMPKMDGVRALELIRATKIFPKLPIVMHSTCGNAATRARCRILGDNGFSMKACDYPKVVGFAKRITSFLNQLMITPDARYDDTMPVDEIPKQHYR